MNFKRCVHRKTMTPHLSGRLSVSVLCCIDAKGSLQRFEFFYRSCFFYVLFMYKHNGCICILKKQFYDFFFYLNPFQLTSHSGPTDWRTTTTTTQLNRSVIKFSIVFACRFIHKANYEHCRATSEHQRSEKESELILRALASMLWFDFLGFPYSSAQSILLPNGNVCSVEWQGSESRNSCTFNEHLSHTHFN